MSKVEPYDKTDPSSIENYAQGLIGMSFRDVMNQDAGYDIEIHEDTSYGSSVVSEPKRNKGNLGQMIEECYFHYKRNNDAWPDFAEAGVELKVTPYKQNQNGSFSAKERLILTMIDYCSVVNETFEDGHFWKKSRLILLVYYLYRKEIKLNVDYRIGYARLFTPPPQDLNIIKKDYELIINKIRAGKAHELSEGDTFYLGAAPKAATSKDRRKQPFSEVPAKPRAFAFKNSYMTFVLNNYIIPEKKTYEKIIADNEVTVDFELFVEKKIQSERGRSIGELCIKYGIETKTKPKNLESLIAFRILGIKGNHAEEFEKAGIVVKAIRIENTGRIKEHMSFPTFKFKELINEEWEDSEFGNYLRETRFFFVIFKYDNEGVLRLLGCQFWNIPYDDLEGSVRNVWEKTKQVIMDGIKTEVVGGRTLNNLPKHSENNICHVRPHAKDSHDTYELPDGRQFPKQCFWLSNIYIYSQLKIK